MRTPRPGTRGKPPKMPGAPFASAMAGCRESPVCRHQPKGCRTPDPPKVLAIRLPQPRRSGFVRLCVPEAQFVSSGRIDKTEQLVIGPFPLQHPHAVVPQLLADAEVV